MIVVSWTFRIIWDIWLFLCLPLSTTTVFSPLAKFCCPLCCSLITQFVPVRKHVAPGLAWFSRCQMLLMLGPADCFRECSQLPAQQLNTVQCPRTHALGAEESLFCPWRAHPMGELLRLEPTSAPSSPSAVFFLPIFATWEVEAGLLQLWVAFSWAVQTGVVFLYILWSCFSFYLFFFLCKSWTNFDLWTVIMYRGCSHIQLVLHQQTSFN